MKISFVIPSRNNLRYFKWAYDSIRKNQGDHDVYICAADDASTDGTFEFFKELEEADPKFSFIRNEGPERVGHTILYDRIVNELVKTEIAIIYHADMYLCPGALDAIFSHLYSRRQDIVDNGKGHPIPVTIPTPVKKTIVSLTRIEPPLHPPGVEKVLQDFGTEPEEFKEQGLLKFVEDLKMADLAPSEGIFAPWAFWVEDFKEVEGHDPLYAPQSKEDSDIFNKFHLNGVKFIQTWDGFVYHMTCRGSRRNTMDGAESIHKDNQEWQIQNRVSHNNFIRKWGHHVLHDEYMKPIVPNKYDIALIVDKGSSWTTATAMVNEPYFSTVYLHSDEKFIEACRKTCKHYATNLYGVESPWDWNERIKHISEKDHDHDIEVTAHWGYETNYPSPLIRSLPLLLDEGYEEGEYEIENLKIKINKANNHIKVPNRIVP